MPRPSTTTPEQEAWLLEHLGVDVSRYASDDGAGAPDAGEARAGGVEPAFDDGVYRPASAGPGRSLLRSVQFVEPAEPEAERDPLEVERNELAEEEARREEENEADRRADREGRPRTPPSDRELDSVQERLRRAGTDQDPLERSRAYVSGKHTLGRLDPANPLAGPDLARPGWVPGRGELQRLERGIGDARAAPTYGLSAAAYRELAEDPDHAGRVDEKSREERDAALNAVRDGQLKGPLARDRRGGDFLDAARQQWDVKSYRSGRPNGFDRKASADDIDGELRLGENVLVNTLNMSEADLRALQEEGVARGWGNRVRYSRSNGLPDRLLLPGGLPGLPPPGGTRR